MATEIQTHLKYANLQMAAEAFILPKTSSPGRTDAPAISVATLTNGNGRSSKFTPTEAQEFSETWTVAEHISNTATGFSGTLFRALKNDPDQGIVAGDLVLSLRSTEFLDDSARDNQATNSMEIKPYGWAFGQIADMEDWYASLKTKGLVAEGQKIAVTGYSLGGHLATAFNLLRVEDGTFNTTVKETYTFNGAGVGVVRRDNTLTNVIGDFNAQRKNVSGSAIAFSDPDAQAQYQKYRALFGADSGAVTAQAATEAATGIAALLLVSAPSTARYEQLGKIQWALERIATLAAEAQRVPNLSSGSAAASPLNIQGPANIQALQLDYQLAVLAAQTKTAPSTGTIGSGIQAVFGRVPGPLVIPNFHDVYGDTRPSAVSNSQLHYGQVQGVFIEDQPLLRGTVIGGALAATANAGWDIKLLVPGFSNNDFGDTHSLVLMQDSLYVQKALAQLDPSLTLETASAILRAASNKKMSWSGSTQGKAEGDVLENVVNALGDMLGLNWQGSTRLKGSLEGNTWAETEDKDGNSGRITFYTRLQAVMNTAAYKALVGKASVSAADVAVDGTTQFASFLALHALSPITFKTTDAPAIAALKAANKALAAQWDADAKLTDAQRADGLANFSRDWYADRQALVQAMATANKGDVTKPVGATPNGSTLEYSYYDTSASTQQTLTVLPFVARNGAPIAHVRFGNDQANTLAGAGQADHLYGGAGDDRMGRQTNGGPVFAANAGEGITRTEPFAIKNVASCRSTAMAGRRFDATPANNAHRRSATWVA